MNVFLIFTGAAAVGLVALARLFVLSRWRAGWAMYLANVVWEIFPKKVGFDRFRLEAAVAAAGLVLLGWGGVPWGAATLFGAALLALEIGNHRWEKRLVQGPVPAGAILTLEAPFTSRRPGYSLGVRWIGVPFDLEVVAVNPGAEPATLRVRLDAPAEWLDGAAAEQILRLDPAGGVGRAKWTLRSLWLREPS